MIGWTALALLIALLAALALGARRAWLRQRQADEEAAWREVAVTLDHAFSTADSAHELESLSLPLLGRIDDEIVAPELTGPSEGGIQRLFLATIDGQRATVAVADLARPVPSCSLRPKGATGPEVGADWAEIDIELVHVRSRFTVRGDDADAVRNLLDGDLGGWLAGEGTEWSIELADHHVLLVREALEVERLVEVAAALDQFRSRLPWAAEVKAPRSIASDVGGGDGAPGSKRKRRRRRGGGGNGNGNGNGNDAGRAGSGDADG